MQKIIPILLLLAGLAVSGTAAYYSIFGLAKMFAGAAFQVIIMASALEVAKIITASAIYRYWKYLSSLLKFYLISAVTILILITSLGVYGFLSSAYEQTSSKDKITSLQIEQVESKVTLFQLQKEDILTERNRYLQEINSLRGHVGTIIEYSPTAPKTSSQNRRLLQKQLDDAIKSRDQLEVRLDRVSDSIALYTSRTLEIKADDLTSAELSPLKYLSRLLNKDMDSIVNVFILLIVVVFDPLAIALLIASSSILLKLNSDAVPRSQTQVHSSQEKSSPPIQNISRAMEVPEEQETSIADVSAEESTSDEESLPLSESPQIEERPDIYQDSPPTNVQLKAMTNKQRLEYIKKKLWQS